MTDEERFEEVLRELGELLLDLGDLSSRAVLIGGQVLALESRRRGGTGVIAIKTETGTEVDRGFSYEPDLLFDLDGTEFMAERLPDVLKQRGYGRTREFRWSKKLGSGGDMHVDLFAPADVERSQLPTAMTPLPDARLALRRTQPVALSIGDTPLRILLPDAVGFLAMKVRAKLEQRPDAHKDSFDIFAYVKLVGPKGVLAALEQAGQDGRVLQEKLLRLFWNTSAPGVQDVMAYATSLEPLDKDLLAQAAVDLFSEF
jgi:hypothetical protein